MRIEIVGAAGSGKSTLTRTLVKGNSKFTRVIVPTTEKIRNFPFFASSLGSILPVIITYARKCDRQFTLHELAWMMIIKKWSKRLLSLENNASNTILLDQGPVFLLTSLYCFGPTCKDVRTAEDFWQPIFSEWASALDMIIFLDASNDCLFQRIFSRPKSHLVLEKNRVVTFDFLDRWRAGYNTVLHQLSIQNPAPRILKIDSERVPIDRICRLVKMEVIHFNTEANQPIDKDLLSVHIHQPG